MSSQTVWLPTALYTALIRWQMDDFTAIGFVNAIFGDKAESQIRQRRYRYTFIYRHLIKLVNQGLLKGSMLMMGSAVLISSGLPSSMKCISKRNLLGLVRL